MILGYSFTIIVFNFSDDNKERFVFFDIPHRYICFHGTFFEKQTELTTENNGLSSSRKKEVVDFLVANFVSGDRWGGVFNSEAKSNYNDWKRRIESMTYTFTNDIDKLVFEIEKKLSSNEDDTVKY